MSTDGLFPAAEIEPDPQARLDELFTQGMTVLARIDAAKARHAQELAPLFDELLHVRQQRETIQARMRPTQ